MERYSAKNQDLPQIVALLSACLSGVVGGTLAAFPSPAIPKLISDYHFTVEEASYITVLPPIAMIIFTPLFCKLVDLIGRKYTLLSIAPLHITSWLLTSFAQNIYVFYLARVFFGISDACLFSTLPVYVAEVTTPRVRSLYGNTISLSMYMGQFFVNCIGFYFSVSHASLILLIFTILFATTFVFMPETPYYLIMKNNIDGAKKALQRLRNCEDVEDELKQLILDVNRQLSERGRFQDLWLIKSNRRAFLIANLCRFFQQLSGFVFFLVYCQYIFLESGTDISSGVAAMIVSGVMAFSNIFGTVVSDKLGRRKSMVLSCFGCGVALFCESTYFYLQKYEIIDTSIINWFPVCGLVTYVIIFAQGLGVVPTLMLGEIFSTSIRGHATAVSNMIFGTYVCIVTKLFQLVMTAYGLWSPFLVFSVLCFIGCITSYFIVPETKGKSLEEIQQLLKGKHKHQTNIM